MTDFARLGIAVDSQPVSRARNELGQFVRAGRSASDAANDLERSTGRARDQFGRFRKTSADTSATVSALGKALGAVAVGLASIASAQQAIVQARGFNAALSETSTLIEGTRLEMSFLQDEAMRLAGTFGGSAEQQVRAFYQAISAGADGVEQAAKILDQSNRLAIGGVTDVTTGVDALTTAVNAYRATGLTAAEASDAMFVGMKAGKTTIGELSAQMGQIVPIASAAGVSFDEMVAGISALTTQGQSTAMATTGLRAAITGILQPSKQASDAAKALGLEFSASALRAKGLEQFMADVVKQTGGSTDAMTKLFGSVEALNAVLAFSGAAGQTFTDIMQEMGEKAGATDAAFGKVASGVDQRLNAAFGKFSNLAIQVGDVLLMSAVPAVEMLAAGAQILSDNFNSVIGVLTATGAAVATVYAPAIYSAVTATGAWVASLVTLRGALLATGVGALVVGAGLLIGKFLDLVDATGGWGAAMRLLGSVASGVWDGIKIGAQALKPALGAVWSDVQASFIRMLQNMNSEWSAFLRAFGAGMEGIPGFSGLQDKVLAAADSATTAFMEMDLAASSLEASAIRLRKEAGELASDGFERASAALKTLNMVVKQHGEGSDAATDAAAELNDALADLDKGSGKAGKALDAAKSEAEAFADAMEDAALTAEDFGKGKADILIGGIDGVANAWGDFVARGFSDFKEFAKNILNSFTGMLSQMIAMAAKNQIMIGLGFSGVSGATVGGVAQTGGGLMNLVGLGAGGGGAISGIASGLGGVLSGGGLGSSFANLGGLVTGSVGGWGAIGAAIPAIGAVAAAISFFSKKTKELDAGLRVTVDGVDSLIESYRLIETSRFWGLSKKQSTSFGAVEDEAAAPIQSAINSIGESVIGFADTLGLASGAVKDVAYQFQLSTKGLSDAEYQEALAKELALLGDEFAGAVVGSFTETNIAEGAADIIRDQIAAVQASYANANDLDRWQSQNGGKLSALQAQLDAVLSGTVDAGSEFVEQIEHFNPAFEALMKEGEGAFDTLERLATSLGAFNVVADTLNWALMDASLASGGAAANIIELTGGIEGFNAASSSYYQAFYSEEERLRKQVQQTRRAMRELGLQFPDTRDGFRALVEAQDLVTSSGQEAFAALLNLSGSADQIYTAWEATAGVVSETTQTLTDLQAIEQERYGLRTQLLSLLGKEDRLRERALKQLDPSNRALQERIWAIQDETAVTEAATAAANAAAEAQSKLLGVLTGDVTSALSAVSTAVGNEIDLINRTVEDKLPGLNEDLETAKSNVDAARSAIFGFIGDIENDTVGMFSRMIDAIGQALASGMGFVEQFGQGLYRSAQSELLRFAGGASFSEEELNKAISGVGSQRIENYGDLVSYARDAAQTNQALRDIQGLTDVQVSEAEQQVAALKAMYGLQEETFPSMDAAISALHSESAKATQIERQIEDLDDWERKQTGMFEDLLAKSQAQVDAALGIDSSVQSLGAALGSLGTALGSLGSLESSMTPDQLRTAAITGNTGNASALWKYEQRILKTDRGDMTKWEQKVFDDLKGKGFSGGGYTGNDPRSGGLDGEGGFLAMLHPRETVVDHHKGQGFGRMSGAEVLRELQSMRRDMAAMQRDKMTALALIAEHTGHTSEDTQQIVRVGVKQL